MDFSFIWALLHTIIFNAAYAEQGENHRDEGISGSREQLDCAYEEFWAMQVAEHPRTPRRA